MGNTSRGYGYITDRKDDRDRLFGAFLGDALTDTLPDTVDLSSHIDYVRDQEISETCVAQFLARAVHMRASIKRAPVAFPSVLAIYAAARREDAGPDVELADLGCRPRSAVKGMLDVGFCSEGLWPFESAKVNDEPPWDVLATCIDGTSAWKGGYYRIDNQGDAYEHAVCAGLAKGFPVGRGGIVDQAFEDYGPSSAPLAAPTGRSLGQHMITIVGYRTLSSGARQYLACNSWGKAWGRDGLFWASAAWLRDPSGTDTYCVSLDGTDTP